MPVQQIAGDSNAVKGQILDGPHHLLPVPPIGPVMEIGYLQDGEPVKGLG
jgi:hypothetical protein